MADRAEFDRCWPWLEEAMRHGGGTHHKEDVWYQLENDPGSVLWTSPRSAAITEVLHHPRTTELCIWLAGSSVGGLEELLALLPHAEAWALERGITEVTLTGRTGWVRVLSAAGFRPHAVTVRKSLKSTT